MAKNSASDKRLDTGMSLLEVLIALSLIGLAVSISGVAVRPLIERQETRDRIRQTESILRQARYQAMLSGQSISLEAFAAERGNASESVPFNLETEVEVFPSGICSPGELRLVTKKGASVYEVERFGCILRAGHGTS